MIAQNYNYDGRNDISRAETCDGGVKVGKNQKYQNSFREKIWNMVEVWMVLVQQNGYRCIKVGNLCKLA